MNWLKTHWKALIAVLVLALGIVWYSRPLDIYSLTGQILKDPDQISVLLRQYDSGAPGGTIQLLDGYTPESPEWPAIQEAVGSLRFRRPPWNLLLQFFDQNVIFGQQAEDGACQIMLIFSDQDAGCEELVYFAGQWTYASPWSRRGLPLWVENARETGDALAETLWSLMDAS